MGLDAFLQYALKEDGLNIDIRQDNKIPGRTFVILGSQAIRGSTIIFSKSPSGSFQPCALCQRLPVMNRDHSKAHAAAWQAELGNAPIKKRYFVGWGDTL